MDGQFAGGFSRGLRDGVDLYNDYGDSREQKLRGEVQHELRKVMSDDGAGLASVIADEGKNSVDANLINKVAMIESGNRDYDNQGNVVTSSKGAKGRMQVMDGTNRDPGFGVMPARDDSLAERSRVGRDYLAAMVNRYNDISKGLAAYNAGPGRLDKVLQQAKASGQDWLSMMPKQTQDYVAKLVPQDEHVQFVSQPPIVSVGSFDDEGQFEQKPGNAANFSQNPELQKLSDSLMRGYRKALELGYPEKALELYVQKERLTGKYREDVLAGAMDRFDLTGNPNSFVPYINMFDPLGSSYEVHNIEKRQEQGGGQPIYVIHGINHESRTTFAQPFSQQALMNYVSSAGDLAAYRGRFAAQAKHLYDMAQQKDKMDMQTQSRLAEIRAQGEENRLSDSQRVSMGIGHSEKTPADVQTAQWLVDQGIAQDPSQAWEMVRSAKSKPKKQYVLETAQMILANQDPMAFGDARISTRKAIQLANEMYDEMGADSRAKTETIDADEFVDRYIYGDTGKTAEDGNKLLDEIIQG